MSAINVLVFITTVIINDTKGIFGHTTKPESKRVSRKLEGVWKLKLSWRTGLWKVDIGQNG